MKTIRWWSIVIVLFLQPFAHAQSSVWEYQRVDDALTEDVTHAAFTRGHDSMLMIGCLDNRLEVLVTLDVFDPGRVMQRTMTYSFDRQIPVTRSWVALDSGGSWLGGEEALVFARHASTAYTVVVKADDVTKEFSLKGSYTALRKLALACPVLRP